MNIGIFSDRIQSYVGFPGLWKIQPIINIAR